MALYLLLVAATIGLCLVLIARGVQEHAEPVIAGGYDLSGADGCFGARPAPPGGPPLPVTAPVQPPLSGASFDLEQSGEFVKLTNAAGTLGAKLRLHQAPRDRPRRLTGTVYCVGGGSRPFAGVVLSGPPIRILFSVAGVRAAATFRRDPPAPGAPLPYTPSSVAGTYSVSPRSVCFGGSVKLAGSGHRYTVSSGSKRLGEVAYTQSDGVLAGDVRCVQGGYVRVRGTASARDLRNVTVIPLDVARPAPSSGSGGHPLLTTASGLPPFGETFDAVRVRSNFGRLLAVFIIAVAAVVLLARLFAMLAMRIGQPRVMGEVVAGILLGPTVLGGISRQFQAQLFPTDIVGAFAITANLGLIFYMFLQGLELDPSQLRGTLGQAVPISNASIALPMLLGIAAAIPLYALLGPDVKFAGYALFLGVAMSITAFPVLARILVERRMLKRPLGMLVLTCGAADDTAGWVLIALASTIAFARSAGSVARTFGLAVAFCLVMVLIVRPLLGRMSDAFDQAGRVSQGWVALIFAGVLVSSYSTEVIGVSAIFGAFVVGTAMPRNAGLTEDVTRRVEDFVLTLLLPMYFAYIGLRMNVGLIDRPVLWIVTVALIGVAIVGKLVGAAVPARVAGASWREAALIGTLMNTRGLTELIVLDVALQQKVITSVLFTMMVLMALVTTLMASPLVALLDRHHDLGAPVEEELVESRKRSLAAFPALVMPERSVLVAAQTDAALATLREPAELLAHSVPPRELILVRLVRPPRGAGVRGGLQSENARVRHASAGLDALQRELVAAGAAARTVAFSSVHPGEDVARLAESEQVDLVLIDGRRPLVGEPLPLVGIKAALEHASCDVGVLVAHEGERLGLGPGAPIVVPFGGAEHDWSALELGAWLASAAGAPLKLLGAADSSEEEPSVQRRLDDAGLLVREFSGVPVESVVVGRGRDGILEGARAARLLVVGLSDRWKVEGLGEVRSRLARSSTAPILFVRRGTRAGALAPRENFTRFTWSTVGAPGAHRLGG